MSIDRRITNGLAWAGAFLVVGIPAADLLSAQFIGRPAAPKPVQIAVVERVAPLPAPLNQRPAMPVAKPATQVAVATPVRAVAKPVAPIAEPAITPAAETADAVDAFLQSGRSLPSYITGADAPAAEIVATPPARTPIDTAPAPGIDPVEVAAIPPQKVAPVPMPLSMRPQPVAVALVRDPAIVIPAGLTPASPVGGMRPPAEVTAAELEEWETGPLSDFLAQRQAGNAYVEPGYDTDGFFLDEGPNRSRARVIKRERGPFFTFVD